MLRLMGVASGTTLLLVALHASPQGGRFLKYKTVEAHEVRPGILMMPRYSDDGRVCEIGLERRHYSSDEVRLDSAMEREVIEQIADELAPASERGPRTMGTGGRDLVTEVGDSLVRSAEYENVSIRLYSDSSRTCRRGNVVAIIQWKNRQCR